MRARGVTGDAALADAARHGVRACVRVPQTIAAVDDIVTRGHGGEGLLFLFTQLCVRARVLARPCRPRHT